MNLNIQKNQSQKLQKNNIFRKRVNALNIVESNELAKHEANDTKNLIESITNAKKEWIRANNDFDYAVDEDMIDYHTYKIKAYQARYEYLIRIAKEKGIRLEIE
jgi:hypothetical protein